MDWATRDLNRYLDQQEKHEELFPKCDECGETIWEYVYNIDGTKYCEDCANDWLKEQRQDAEDWMESNG